MTRLPLLVAGALAVAGAAFAAHADTLYSNDFEGGSTQDFSGVTTITEAPNGTTAFLGQLSTNNGVGTTTLTLDTAGYTSLTLSYTVYAIQSVDGDGPFGGNSPSNPDAFIVGVNGGATLEDYSFANYPGNTQDYPIPGSAPMAGAVATNSLGYTFNGVPMDATYTFTYTFTPTGDTTAINFTGQTDEDISNESFGLDNVVVTGVPAMSGAPEPGTWALMTAGVAMVGGALRRGRRRGLSVAVA